jgi:predicted nucleic acid-binding protein
MKVLFDADVVLDLLLDRQPHSAFAGKLLSRVEVGRTSGYLCASAVTTIHYLAAKVVGAARARAEVRRLLGLFEIAPVNRGILGAALDGKFPDFEDAVTHEAARQINAQAIVTRNLRDFKHSAIPVYSPADMLALLEAEETEGE